MLTVNPEFPRLCPQIGAWRRFCSISVASSSTSGSIDSARRISPIEYISLLAIALLILQIGFIAGVLIGVIIGCATFAVSASRVNAIKFSFDGSEYRSTLDRAPEELAILSKHGRQIQGMSLQSYLFFGSANRLYQQVKALFSRKPVVPLSRLRLPPGDRYRLLCHAQLHPDKEGGRGGGGSPGPCQSARARSSTPSAPAASSPAMSSVADDLDRALETCEKAVIVAHLAERRTGQTLT